MLADYWFKDPSILNNLNEFNLTILRKYLTNVARILGSNNDYEVIYSNNNTSYVDQNKIKLNYRLVGENIDYAVGDIIKALALNLFSNDFQDTYNKIFKKEGRTIHEFQIYKWLETYRSINLFSLDHLGGYKPYLDKWFEEKFYTFDQLVASIFKIEVENIIILEELKNLVRNHFPTNLRESIELSNDIYDFLKLNLPTHKIDQNEDISVDNTQGEPVKKGRFEFSKFDKSNVISVDDFEFKEYQHSTLISDINGEDELKYLTPSMLGKSLNTNNRAYIDEGLKLGKKLTKKLKFKNQHQSTVYSGQKRGYLDKKSLNRVRFTNRVFSKTIMSDQKPTHIHLSIDGSGSMNDKGKYRDAIKLCAGLMLISKELPDVRISISSRNVGHNQLATTTIFFDSDKDSFKQGINKLDKISFAKGTPEGMCFGGILDYINNPNEKTYFINVSDGAPSINVFPDVIEVTKKQVKRFQTHNIQVLSYLVDSDEFSIFQEMYGKSSVKLNIEDFNQISNDINKLLINE